MQLAVELRQLRRHAVAGRDRQRLILLRHQMFTPQLLVAGEQARLLIEGQVWHLHGQKWPDRSEDTSFADQRGAGHLIARELEDQRIIDIQRHAVPAGRQQFKRSAGQFREPGEDDRLQGIKGHVAHEMSFRGWPKALSAGGFGGQGGPGDGATRD